MSTSVATWSYRKTQLNALLGNCDDDEEEGIALDRIMHGQLAIGKTQRTIDIDGVRFCDKDLTSFGPLADAQFGTVELVSCRLDGRVYVRKRVSKKFALKTREQCSPQSERHILLLALKSQSASSAWTPQMLCAYQCPDFLNIVMEYAAGGSLWDVLESSGEGRLAATDLAWWAPQCVAAIEWLHSHAGFTHRDIKPHNFVVRPGPAARLLLIDFGSAAPLLAPDPEGVQLVPRSNCLVPCGTCDYISPEILMAHEEALVALEMSDDECEEVADDSDAELHGRWKGKAKEKILRDDVGYGRETDWWSLGVMLYELAFGVAPFFANDIRQTYARIMSHESNLRFDSKVHVPQALVEFIKGLLTHHERRLGRYSPDELKNHAYFRGVDWLHLHSRPSPPNLLLPEFTYTTPLVPPEPDENSETSADGSKPFAFSALFQSSVDTPSMMLLQQDLMATPANGRRSMSRSVRSSGSTQKSLASFIGFSWGPPKDAFDDATRTVPAAPASTEPGLCVPPLPGDSSQAQHPLMTPMRPSRGSAPPPSTVRVTSVRRSAQARPVSDREAMKMLVNCVGQSARKKVLESGKKPKILLPHFGFAFPPPPPGMTSGGDNSGRSRSRSRAPSYSRSSPRSSVLNAVRKELRFDDTTQQIMPNLSYTNTFTTTTFSNSGMSMPIPYIPPPYSASDSGTASSETEGPPSPSPSPRPGSAMSMLSLSRRSATPTATMSSAYLMGGSVPPRSSSEPPEGRARKRAGSLGSLRGRKSGEVDGDEDEDVPIRNRNGNGMVVQQTPRRARFADSPGSSLERPTEKDRIPGTPYHQPSKKAAAVREEKQPPNTRQPRFVEPIVPASTPKPVRSRVPSTPHPKGLDEMLEDEDSDDLTPRPRRTHFLDPLLSGEENKKKERVPSTPHPLAKAEARKTSRPPLQAMRTRSSTPARRKKELSSVEDDLTRRQGRSRRNSLSGSETEENPVEKEGYLWEDLLMSDRDAEMDKEMERALQSRGGTPPSPVTPAQEYEFCDHEYGESLDTMERRYVKLLADLADVRTRIDGLVALV